MKYLFYLGHPAHFHLFKNIIEMLKSREHHIIIVVKKKDVLENLLINEGWDYYNIYPKVRKDNKLSIAISLLERDIHLLKIVKKEKPVLMIGTSSEITHVGRMLNIPSVVVNEDDADQVPFFAHLSYPFANAIIAPGCCRTGKWHDKSVFYEGYHELAYLHPKYFTPNPDNVKELFHSGLPFYILRFAELSAHHDKGKTGITKNLALEIAERLSKHGNVYITSERELEPELEKYRLKINPSIIHDALFYADMYIGDSQTMAAEAAVLGTPSLRFNDFVRKLSYLDELEDKYGLTYGIKTNEPEKLLAKIDELLNIAGIKKQWQEKKNKMLADKIDVVSFFSWYIETYPESGKQVKTADFQLKFRTPFISG